MKRNLEPTTDALAINQEFVRRRDEVTQKLLRDGDGLKAAEALTGATDDWVCALWRAAGDFPASLVALGGFGRCELCLGSDVDLVIEVDDGSEGSGELLESVERFIAWARQTRVKLSHAVRTRAQTFSAFNDDVRTAVAYLDARPLTPTHLVDASTAAAVLRGDDAGIGFVSLLLDGYRARLSRFGQTIYLLEPDLKNGKGALRDLHTLRWAAHVRGESYAPNELGRKWLLDVRGLLHALHGRKHDRLHFPDQEQIAAIMLRESSQPSAAAETLMREHYQTTRAIARATERNLRMWSAPPAGEPERLDAIFRLAGSQLSATATADLNLGDVMHGLSLASKHNALLDPGTEAAFEQVARSTAAPVMADYRAFRDLLTDPRQSPRTSTRLLELTLLPRLIPEFEPVVCHVQHDVYHVFTTDVHLLRCLEFAREMIRVDAEAAGRWPQFAGIAQRIEDKEVFLLSALLHDVGKNRGGGHSEKGAAMCLDIGPRLDLDPERTALLSFLVREHLVLSHVARRHDLSDPRLVRDLAARIRTVEALNQLTALTFCDMSTVGNTSITDWNASLLLQLHERLDATIRHGVEEAWRLLERDVDVVRQWLQDNVSEGRARVDAFVRDLPPTYLVEASTTALARAFEVWHRGQEGETAVMTTPDPERGSTEVIISAPDTHGVLAQITGAISSVGMNILDARIITTSSGRLLDIFQVAKMGGASHALDHAEQTAVTDEARLARLRALLAEVIGGKADAAELLERRLAESKLPPRVTPEVETVVEEIPDLSDAFTVVQVKAPDRVGLLYDIARTLAQCRVDIRLSKIDSVGTQVVDTFYLETLAHERLSPEQVDEVVAALLKAVS